MDMGCVQSFHFAFTIVLMDNIIVVKLKMNALSA